MHIGVTFHLPIRLRQAGLATVRPMKRGILALSVALGCLAASGAQAGQLSPGLQKKLMQNPGQTLNIIVRFRIQDKPGGRDLFKSLRAQLQQALGQLGPLAGFVAQALSQNKAAQQLWLDQSIVIKATPLQAQALALLPVVDQVFENFPVRVPKAVALSQSAAPASTPWHLDKIGAPELWAAGFKGQGVRIGHLDTGVDPKSPELAGKILAFAEFDADGKRVNSQPHDSAQHGTHTAGLLVGSKVGVAPDAKIISALVLPGGEGTFAEVIAGMQWVLDPDNNADTNDGANVVSMSLGLPGTYQEFVQPVRNMIKAGVIPVFSVGNFGPNPASTGSPGNIPDAIGVGAVDQAGKVTAYSSRGPVQWTGEYSGSFVKPDLVAPGDKITSTVPGGYEALSGTSQAAPIVAGGVALLLSAKPGTGVDAIKQALFQSASNGGAKNNDSGYGLINLPGAAAKLGVSVKAAQAPQPTPSPQPAPTPQPTPQPAPAPAPAPQPVAPAQVVKKPVVLLVDDDMGVGPDVTAALRDTIRALSSSPLRWDVQSQGRVTLDQLQRAQVVIWASGENYTGTISPQDQTTLRAYLKAGGRLIVTGQDVGYDIGGSDFYRDVLKTRFVADSSGTASFTAQGPLGSGRYTLNAAGSAQNQLYPDVLAPLSGAQLAASWGGSGTLAGHLQPQSIKVDKNQTRVRQKVRDPRGEVVQVVGTVVNGLLSRALGGQATRQPGVRAQSADVAAGAIVLNDAGTYRTANLGFGLEGLAPTERESLLRSLLDWLTR